MHFDITCQPTIAGLLISSREKNFLFASIKAKPIFVVERDPFSSRSLVRRV